MEVIKKFFPYVQPENYHMGHYYLAHLLDKPDNLNQIDGATGEQETNAQVLSRTVRLAKCLRRLGLQPGDVMALGGRNHIDLHIPHYAALVNGLPLVGVDPYFKYEEIYMLFERTKPKIAFCQHSNHHEYKKAAQALDLDTKVITFDKGECTFKQILDSYDEDGSLEGFEPARFDPDKIYVWLASTGGTMGRSKLAAIKHSALLERYIGISSTFDMAKLSKGTNKLSLNVSPPHWVSGLFNATGPNVMGMCKLQTSGPDDIEHVIDIINKYKPVTVFASPSFYASLLTSKKECDLTCFTTLSVTGGKVFRDILTGLKKRIRKDAVIIEAYGQTESIGAVLRPSPFGPFGNSGVPSNDYQLKLIDPETEKEITEPNTTGELWVKGPSFTEYYGDPEETVKAFTEDGWFKTGDLLYRDENNFYFFVDRIKMLIKYRNNHVVPLEIESVIRTHPGVLDVCVTSVLHPLDGEHIVAYVVRRPDTAKKIENLVAETFSDSKRLRGGVIFADTMPMTSTGKVARMKVREIVRAMHQSHKSLRDLEA